MKYINYDFSGLEKSMSNIKIKQTPDVLRNIKNELNKFFKDSICEDVLYTKNTDKLFFGMCVAPVIDSYMTTKILLTDEKIRINKYYVEIDSKLIDLGLSNKELTACILHEVGHMVNDSTPIDELRKNVDVYTSQTDGILSIENIKNNSGFLIYGIKDALIKISSLFNKKDEEILADEFVIMCGYGPYLESALKKIVVAIPNLNNDVSNKFIVLIWSLKMTKEMKYNRIRALETLDTTKKMSASKLVSKEITKCRNFLSNAKLTNIVREESMFKAIGNKMAKIRHDMKMKGMRQLEDDLYEYALRVKNVDEQEEALSILRELNSKMSIIEDYIYNENLSEQEKKKWFALLDRYIKVRDDLSKKTTYDEKYYGLFVKTPVIKSRYEV